MFSHTLEDMISSLLGEENITIARGLKEDSQLETTPYSKKMIDNSGFDCYYCKKSKSYNNSLQDLCY